MENNTNNSAAQTPAQGAANASTPYNQGGAKKSSSILTIVFLITTLGFAGAFAWAMLRDNSGAKSDMAGSAGCAVTEEEVATAKEGSVGEIVANYDSDKEVKSLVEELNAYLGTRGDTVSAPILTVDSGSVLKQVEGNLYTKIKKSYGLTYVLNDLSLADTYSSAFDTFMGQKGFVKNPSLTDDYNVYYEQDGDIRCVASALSSPASIDCSNLNWLKDEDATLVKNLYSAYSASEGAIDGNVVIVADGSKIETSKNGKFETMQAGISGLGATGGFAGLFYREVDSESWTFYKGTQAPLPCDGFTGDAREAFAGMTCVTNGGYDLGTVGGE